MVDPELGRYLKSLVKLGVILLSLLSFYVLVRFVLPIAGHLLVLLPKYIAPFIIALLLAVLIEPLVVLLEGRARMSRGWAVAISLLLVYGGLGWAVVGIFMRIARELAGLYELANAHSNEIAVNVLRAVNDLQLFYLRMNLPADFEHSLTNAVNSFMNSMEHLLSSSATGLVGLLMALPNFFVFLIVVGVASYFMARDRKILQRRVFGRISGRKSDAANRVFDDLMNSFLGFVKAEAILVSITAVQTIVGLAILRVDYALTLGLVVGLFDILPVLGPGTVFIPWIIWEFAVGKAGFAIGLLIVYAIIVAVRQILEPRILGNNIGLHPLLTLLALYVGLQAGGIVGMILGPVLVVFILSMWRAGMFDDIGWLKRR